MQLKRVDFQTAIEPPGRAGATRSLVDLKSKDRDLDMVFSDGLVTIRDRGTGAVNVVPMHNVARLVPVDEVPVKVAAVSGKR
jgi:hypothetical protein